MTDDTTARSPIEPTRSRPPSIAGRRGRAAFRPARTAGGIGAVGVKELRGRMRGRRAFVILTIYLLLLGGFAWMVELIMERTYSSGFGGSSDVRLGGDRPGHLRGLLMLQTLLVAFLAPAATAGAISLEREKQTLELLAVTPISSLAIVLGKLFSALVYVLLLIVASIPLTALVFVFGGVAPDDVVRGYIVLFVTALGLRVVRAVLLEPRQADPGGDRDHDLRRPRLSHRVAVRARLLAGDGDPRQRPGDGPIKGRRPRRSPT